MKLIQGTLFLIAGFAGYELFKMFTAAGRLKIGDVRLQTISFEGGNPVAVISIVVDNTSNESFQVNSISADLYAMQEGRQTLIGTVYNFDAQKILPNQRTMVAAKVSLKIVSLVQDLIKVLQYKNFSLPLRLEGSMNLNKYVIPIDESFNVP